MGQGDFEPVTFFMKVRIYIKGDSKRRHILFYVTAKERKKAIIVC